MTASTSKDAVSAFFDELEQREYEPLLKKARGKVRLDLVDGKRIEARYLTIDRGKIQLSKSRVAGRRRPPRRAVGVRAARDR